MQCPVLGLHSEGGQPFFIGFAVDVVRVHSHDVLCCRAKIEINIQIRKRPQIERLSIGLSTMLDGARDR